MFNCGCAQQAGQLRRQHAAAPGGRRADPQQATRLYLQTGHIGLGLLHLLQHLPASGQIGAAGFGQALAAGVPLQQRGTQMRLQLLDVLPTITAETCSCSAAPAKLPRSATATKACMHRRVSITNP
jgi:hypothetical protein